MVSFVVVWFLGLHYFAAAQAGGADAHALGSALHFGANRAQVDVPASTRHVVGVADGISELRPSAADITHLCHDCSREISELDVQNIDFTGVEVVSATQDGHERTVLH
jgi:hypothetical protein